jgi:hypothetical protein
MRIFGPTREAVTRRRRKLHNEKHLYPSVNVIRVANLRKMRLTGHETLMG